MLFTEELMDKIVVETNHYAEYLFEGNKENLELKKLIITDTKKMKVTQFLAPWTRIHQTKDYSKFRSF